MDEKELQSLNDQVNPVEPMQGNDSDIEELELEEIPSDTIDYQNSSDAFIEPEYTQSVDNYQTNEQIVSQEVTPDYNTYGANNTTNFFEGLTNDEVPVSPVLEQPVEEKQDEQVEIKPIEEINEHPDGKIKLNFDKQEEPEEEIKHTDIKVDIRGNKNLMYVLGLGLFILVIIILLPLFA